MNCKKAIEGELFDYLAELISETKQKTYVIGGFVRDYLLARSTETKDVDVVTVGNGIDLALNLSKRLPNKPKVQVFKTYGTAMLRFNTTEVEFVGARKESYVEESRNPTVESGSLEDDQRRRDFTINALAISLNPEDYGVLIDPFNGMEDLKNKVIRTPLDPKITYTDDPLRMLRAIRFATQLQFTIEKKSLDAISEHAARIDIISKERIVTELHKILGSEKPSIGFRLLADTGLLERILPELMALKGVEEEQGQRHKDNFYHTLQVVDNIAEKTDNIWLRWTALFHDIGKARTKRFDKAIGWTFHNHEYVGSRMVYKIFKRLKMPLNEKMKYVQKLVLLSSRPVVLSEDVTDSAVRRLIFDAGNDIEDLMTHCEADITTQNTKKLKRYLANFKKVREKIADVEERDHVRNFQPPITGELIMKTFNLKPSKEIGKIKEVIKEAILEGEIQNDFDQAYALMVKTGEKLGLTLASSPSQGA